MREHSALPIVIVSVNDVKDVHVSVAILEFVHLVLLADRSEAVDVFYRPHVPEREHIRRDSDNRVLLMLEIQFSCSELAQSLAYGG